MWDQKFWLWPLPPAGKLLVALEWPSENVALTMHELDPAPILDAAVRSLQLWPEEPPSSGGGSSSFTVGIDPRPYAGRPAPGR